MPLAPTRLRAFQKGRLFAALRAGGQRLKTTDEPALAVVSGAHLAHGFLPLGRQPRPLVAIPGALEIRQRGTLVLNLFAFLSADTAAEVVLYRRTQNFSVAIYRPSKCNLIMQDVANRVQENQ